MSVQAIEGLVIGGERVDAAEGRTFEVVNPASATALATVAEGGVEDAEPRRGGGASKAYEGWGALSPVTRGRRMHRFAALVEEHAEELALLECRNVGMPISDARGQLGMIVDVIRYYAGAVDKFFGHTDPGRARRHRADVPRADRRGRPDHALELPAQHRELEDRARARRGEHGRPEACVAHAALGPALRGAGHRGGDPGGGAERRARARRDRRRGARRAPRTSARSASPARPRSVPGIARQAAATIKRVTLELGGKSACIVFADADLEKVGPDGAVRGLRELRAGLLRPLAADRRGVGQGRAARALCRDGRRAARWHARGRSRPRSGRSSRPAQRETVEGYVRVGHRRGRQGRRRRRTPGRRARGRASSTGRPSSTA